VRNGRGRQAWDKAGRMSRQQGRAPFFSSSA
jgi:hypothetical protein